MKKIKYLVILLLPFLMTGCVKINASMKIKMDKSMNYEIIEAVDTSAMENLGGSENGSSSTSTTSLISDEDLDKYKKLGFTIKEYNEDNMKGYRITRHFKNIDTISTKDDTNADISMNGNNQYLFKVKKGFFKNTYTAILKNNETNEYTGQNSTEFGSAEEQQQYEELMKQLDLKFNVELPFKVKSNNATTVTKGGKKLEWDLTKHQDDIKFTFELYNIENVAVVFGIIFVGLIGIIIGYIKTRDKNDNNNSNQQNSNDNMTNNSIQPNNNFNSIESQVINTPIQNDNMINQVNQQPQNNPFITNDPFIQNNNAINQANQQPQNNPFITNDPFIQNNNMNSQVNQQPQNNPFITNDPFIQNDNMINQTNQQPQNNPFITNDPFIQNNNMINQTNQQSQNNPK